MQIIWSPLAIDFGELLFGEYRVVYRVEPKQVSILTVRHGRRPLDLSEVTEAP